MSEMSFTEIDVTSFTDSYDPATPVMIGEMVLTLEQALRAEAEACTADIPDRNNQIGRIRFMAKILDAGGSLRPEDKYLLELQKD